MDLKYELKDLLALEDRLQSVGKEFSPRVMSRVTKRALEPLLNIAQHEVPESNNGYESVSLSRNRGRSNDYRRGGATKRDLRILMVQGENEEMARGLVGVSKKSGHVGWRTHLITRANKNRRVANDFLARAETQGIPLVIARLGDDARQIVEKMLKKR